MHFTRFFASSTYQGKRLSIEDDYYRHHYKRKKAKRRISVRFELPPQSTFRRDLHAVSVFLGGRTFEIAKQWSRGSAEPEYFLNSEGPVSPDQREKLEQFLSLISFRYIPNRVLPLDVIRNEHQSLRDVLIRRLARKTARQTKVFDALRDTSGALVKAVAKYVHETCPDVGDVRLATGIAHSSIIRNGYDVGARRCDGSGMGGSSPMEQPQGWR